MQITETSADGLKREFKVVIPAQDIDKAVDAKLAEVGKTIRVPGFRPGKVPMPLLKQRYGMSVLSEVLEDLVSSTSQSAMTERGLRLALQPKITVSSAFEPGKDLEYDMAAEILPDVEPGDFSTLSLERNVAAVDEKAIDETIDRVAKANATTVPSEEGHAAVLGDTLTIDFDGSVDGEKFPGMKGEGFSLRLGSKSFIDTFEDQLVGAKAGDHRTVNVTFPENYGKAELSGKAAVFEVDVKEVLCAAEPIINDDFAKQFGCETVDALRTMIKDSLSKNYADASRYHLKRQLLDKLAESYTFAVPQGMVELEFDAIWKRLQEELKAGRAQDEAGKSEETLKTEYRAIAERRVRLGLLLAEVGRRHDIQVPQDDLNKAIVREARRYPGQEKQVFDFFRSNPRAIESLRAPLFEDKVVDFIIELAKVSEKAVSIDELMHDFDEEDAA